jgi:hypothetical protein
MLAAQATSNFGGEAAEHLVSGINHKPVALHLMRFGGESLHLKRRPFMPDHGKPRILLEDNNVCQSLF